MITLHVSLFLSLPLPPSINFPRFSSSSLPGIPSPLHLIFSGTYSLLIPCNHLYPLPIFLISPTSLPLFLPTYRTFISRLPLFLLLTSLFLFFLSIFNLLSHISHFYPLYLSIPVFSSPSLIFHLLSSTSFVFYFSIPAFPSPFLVSFYSSLSYPFLSSSSSSSRPPLRRLEKERPSFPII